MPLFPVAAPLPVAQLAQQAGGNLKPEDLRVVYKLQVGRAGLRTHVRTEGP